MVCAVLLFAKRPVPGRVKTRLAARIGDELAASVARAMLEETRRLVERSTPGPWWICGDATQAGEFTLGFDRWRYHAQGDGHLGERLERAFRSCFAAGIDGAVAIGADTPHLPASYLREALAIVSAGSVALGPCEDGGYYLIGAPRSRPLSATLFAARDWGTDRVLGRTREALAAESRARVELNRFWDVDDLADLVRWCDLCEAGSTGRAGASPERPAAQETRAALRAARAASEPRGA